MKAATVTFLVITLLAAFASAANTTNTTNTTVSLTNVTCSSGGNGSACTSTLGFTSCCALFVGVKPNTTGNGTNGTSYYYCANKALVDTFSGTITLGSYKGTLSCVNSGILTKVTAFIVSVGIFSVFA